MSEFDPTSIAKLLQQIPSVDRLIHAASSDDDAHLTREYMTAIAREVQAEARELIRSGTSLHPQDVEALLQDRLREINTGGLAPIVNGTGDRGGRGSEVARAFQLLTGAEAALVVNNNAAAVNIVLSALAHGKKVVVSRSEAVEIGGGFRIPDVLRQSGAILTEVGTTNRTRVSDYENAIDDETAALMKVHASNFVILGFTAQPSIGDVVSVARRHDILAIEDMGSGCLIDPRQFGLGPEPLLADSIAAGADVVTASGDKLLGGPQAGIILGKKHVIDRIARHPLARALRVDKTVQAGLDETLRHYLRGEAIEEVPIWWSISRDVEWLRTRVLGWIQAIDDHRLECVPSESVVGGGSLPGRILESTALAIRLPHQSVDAASKELRMGSRPIFPRIHEDTILIDARTVLADEDEIVTLGVKELLAKFSQ